MLSFLLKLCKMALYPPNTVSKPLVIILGATGTGKTKLSVEIAAKYNGEVLNADAMQMYKGLEIITNKATTEERNGIPHHLIGFIEPQHRSTVLDFQDRALKIISALHEQKKLPIVVGGTSYYLESLLYNLMAGDWDEEYNRSPKVGDNVEWCDLLNGDEATSTTENSDLKHRAISVLRNAESPSSDLFKILEEIDPKQAAVLHPNDGRKITRAIGVWLKTGLRISDIYNKQQKEAGGKSLGGIKRFKNVLIFWLKAERQVLIQRQDERVKDMIYRGLLEEVTQFHDHYNKNYITEDIKCDKRGYPLHYQQGVFQCIGFKEFHDYLMLSTKDQDSEKGRTKYLQSILLMQMRTHRYSKAQEKWIKNRLLIRDRHSYPLYGLDSTDPSKWSEVVTPRVDRIVDAFLHGHQIPFEAEAAAESDKHDHLVKGDQVRYHCDVCNVMLLGQLQYAAHTNGARHAKMVARIERNEAQKNKAISQHTDQSPPEKKHSVT